MNTTTTMKTTNSNFTEYGALKRTLNGHTNRVYALTTLPNGDLASASSDQTLKIWNPNDGNLKLTLNGHNSLVKALTTLPNGDLVSGADDKTIKIWNTGS